MTPPLTAHPVPPLELAFSAESGAALGVPVGLTSVALGEDDGEAETVGVVDGVGVGVGEGSAFGSRASPVSGSQTRPVYSQVAGLTRFPVTGSMK